MTCVLVIYAQIYIIGVDSMALMNRADLEGYLTSDVQLNKTQKGTSVTTIALANDRPFKNKDGEQHTDFPIVTLWGKQADVLHKYAGKGSLISVTGRTQTRHYKNKDGKTVYVQEIVADNNGMEMLKTKKPGQSSNTDSSKENSSKDSKSVSAQVNDIDKDNQDLPF